MPLGATPSMPFNFLQPERTTRQKYGAVISKKNINDAGYREYYYCKENMFVERKIMKCTYLTNYVVKCYM
jgi:hypothetical protein